MAYILEHEEEAQRLELQKEIKAYSIADELKGVELDNKLILDAGCGGGDVSRHILENSKGSQVFGCDQSDIRAAHAKKKNPKGTFFVSSLDKIDADDDSFDLIVCRYVFEYLNDPIKVLEEFKRVTKSGGEIVVIDIDGVFKNLYTANSIFNEQLDRVVSLIDVDLSAGRKIASQFHQANIVTSKVQMSSFLLEGEDLALERKNSEMRLFTIKPVLEDILGPKEAELFIRDYLSLMSLKSSTIFFNKFIVRGIIL